MLDWRSGENTTAVLTDEQCLSPRPPRPTYQQEIFNSEDVAAQDGRPDLLHPEALATPRCTGSRDDVIASDRGQLLRQHLGLAIGEVGVAGYDGGFGNHNSGTGVFKVGMDGNLVT